MNGSVGSGPVRIWRPGAEVSTRWGGSVTTARVAPPAGRESPARAWAPTTATTTSVHAAAADTWVRNLKCAGNGWLSTGDPGADVLAESDLFPCRTTGSAASPATLPPSRAMAGSCQAKSTHPAIALL